MFSGMPVKKVGTIEHPLLSRLRLKRRVFVPGNYAVALRESLLEKNRRVIVAAQISEAVWCDGEFAEHFENLPTVDLRQTRL